MNDAYIFFTGQQCQNKKKLKGKTISAIDNAVIACSKKCGFERGGNLRGDSFVCKSNIHYPSESSILFDCGRVLVLINESRKISETIIGRQFPVAIEFGRKIFLNQSESGFIVDWDIMKPGATDAEMIEPSIEKIKKNHSLTFKCCSYDKGFHAPENQKRPPKIFQTVVIPKKGKCNKEESEREHLRKFIRLGLWRAGIESLISSLVRGNGMGLRPDRGLENYRKYIAGCVLARNLQKFGEYLIADQEKKIKK